MEKKFEPAEGKATIFIQNVFVTNHKGEPLYSSKGARMAKLYLSVIDSEGKKGMYMDYITALQPWKREQVLNATGCHDAACPENIFVPDLLIGASCDGIFKFERGWMNLSYEARPKDEQEQEDEEEAASRAKAVEYHLSQDMSDDIIPF